MNETIRLYLQGIILFGKFSPHVKLMDFGIDTIKSSGTILLNIRNLIVISNAGTLPLMKDSFIRILKAQRFFIKLLPLSSNLTLRIL